MPFDMSAQQLWEAVLGRLQVQVTRPAFDTWLKGTSGIGLADRRLLVGVPTAFAAEWLEHRMYQLIDAAVSAVVRSPLEVVFEVRQPHTNGGPAPELPATAPRPARPMPDPNGSPVSPHHTFDSFVVSGSNQLAHAAAAAVADRPGGQFNPLFIYSGVGLGKTHLLHAIATRAQARGAAVLYTSTEQFTNDFIAAIREHKTTELRHRHRQVDVLLMDDIQFISGKEQTQEGFFHTFNSLHSAERQVVIASDRPPAALPVLSDRLRSRFEGGLVADIQQPELETRVAILLQRCRETAVAIPNDVIAYLARRFASNVRQLEGGLTRVTAMAQFVGTPITLEMAKQVLGPEQEPRAAAQLATPHHVLKAVAQYYGVGADAITGTTRAKRTVRARHSSILLLSEDLRMDANAVGELIGGQTPRGVRKSLSSAKSALESSPAFWQEIDHIRAAIHPATGN